MIRRLTGTVAVMLTTWLTACAPTQVAAPPPAESPPLQTATADATMTPAFTATPVPTATLPATVTPTATPTPTHPLMIEVMRQQAYPGSALTFEQTLLPGANYNRFIVSYLSEGNKIYALMTIPEGDPPPTGWPVVIFNHGYIPPAQYRTTERYVAYADGFARHGYIVFKSDYRGHGSSEGEASGGYDSPAYTIDVLNGLASVKTYVDADLDRIGMWGHSMGGQITLRAMVVSNDIKAGVIWGGVVASYPDLIQNWRRGPVGAPTRTPNPEFATRGRWRNDLLSLYGDFDENPEFWASISPNSYLPDLSGPIQLHHGTADEDVPVDFSQNLFIELQHAGIATQLFLYPGDNHDISGNFDAAMQRSIQFFDEVVKEGD